MPLPVNMAWQGLGLIEQFSPDTEFHQMYSRAPCPKWFGATALSDLFHLSHLTGQGREMPGSHGRLLSVRVWECLAERRKASVSFPTE